MRSSSLCLAVLVLAVILHFSAAQCTSSYFTPNGTSNAAGTSTGTSITSDIISYIALNPITLTTSIQATGLSIYPMSFINDSTTSLAITAGIYTGIAGGNLTLLAQAGAVSTRVPATQTTLSPLTMQFSTPTTLSAGSYFIGYWYSWYGGVLNRAVTFGINELFNTTTHYYTAGSNYTYGAVMPTVLNTNVSQGYTQPGQLSAIVTAAACPLPSSTGPNAAAAMALPSGWVFAMLLVMAVMTMVSM